MSRTSSLKLIIFIASVCLLIAYVPTEHIAVTVIWCLVALLINVIARSIIDAYVENK